MIMTMKRNIGRRREHSRISVSLFRNYTDPRPCDEVDLADFLLTSTYQGQVEAIRACVDKSDRRALKMRLPAITPSGVFSKRCNDELIRHSEIICIDIDGNQNPGIGDWQAVKSTIADIPGLWYAGLSAGGNGMFLLFRVAHPKWHAEHFAAIARELQGRGLIVDIACKDVARLRGASYDPQPYYNPNTEAFAGILTAEPIPRHTTSPPSEPDRTANRVRQLVDTIERTDTDITDSYEEWYAIGRALAAEFGEGGRTWYHIISAQSSKYRPKECDQQYNKCLRTCSRTIIGTLFGICKNYGLTIKSCNYETAR